MVTKSGGDEVDDDRDNKRLWGFKLMEWRPHVLVLGPGGVKGFLELGALVILDDNEYLEAVSSYIGVSIGSIISLLLVCGYTPRKIVNIMVEFDLLVNVPRLTLGQVIEHSGLISSDPIRKRVEYLVETKFGYIPTLSQLYDLTSLRFISVTLNVDRDRTEYICYKTAPDFSCVEAVMLSMNIPILFYKLLYKGDVCVDGALGNPYPVDYLDDGHTNILGLYIREMFERKETEVVPSIVTISSEGKSNSVGLPFTVYMSKVIQSTATQYRSMILKHCSKKCKHIELQTKIIDTIGLSTTIKDKYDMLLIGEKAARDFIAQNKAEYRRTKRCIKYCDSWEDHCCKGKCDKPRKLNIIQHMFDLDTHSPGPLDSPGPLESSGSSGSNVDSRVDPIGSGVDPIGSGVDCVRSLESADIEADHVESVEILSLESNPLDLGDDQG